MNSNATVQASKGRQLSIFLDDRPGTLGQVTALLGDRKINIFALTLAEGTGHGYVRMVVDRHADAERLLREKGYLFFERDVVLLDIPNTPGSLAALAQWWGKNGINVEYAYCAGGPRVDRGLVVVRTNDNNKALAVLNEQDSSKEEPKNETP